MYGACIIHNYPLLLAWLYRKEDRSIHKRILSSLFLENRFEKAVQRKMSQMRRP